MMSCLAECHCSVQVPSTVLVNLYSNGIHPIHQPILINYLQRIFIFIVSFLVISDTIDCTDDESWNKTRTDLYRDVFVKQHTSKEYRSHHIIQLHIWTDFPSDWKTYYPKFQSLQLSSTKTKLSSYEIIFRRNDLLWRRVQRISAA